MRRSTAMVVALLLLRRAVRGDGRRASTLNRTMTVWQRVENDDSSWLEGRTAATMGLSVGGSDIYPAGITYQWIDITALPNGDYVVSADADPSSSSPRRQGPTT